MKKALLVIDYTYDFVASDGKLTCGEPGQALLDQFHLGVIASGFVRTIHSFQNP
ncbi:hypothetical protein [Lysinibacillus sp. RC79]|uniref:hypothetical protein n=1 Tax=Lysinibacillus sp. RC79 TaxID=3156296 RepID=UPI0035159092